ncbi:MAG: hypothetical protein N2322_02360, partial [Terrimicrobiaceae bacterium]|nr:hypothetical protein [Terrimicrobiaceae bacterium]
MAIFKKPILKALGKRSKEMPGGLWTKCPSCGEWSHAWNTRLGVCLDCIRFCAICYTPVVSSESVVVDGVRY